MFKGTEGIVYVCCDCFEKITSGLTICPHCGNEIEYSDEQFDFIDAMPTPED